MRRVSWGCRFRVALAEWTAEWYRNQQLNSKVYQMAEQRPGGSMSLAVLTAASVKRLEHRLIRPPCVPVHSDSGAARLWQLHGASPSGPGPGVGRFSFMWKNCRVEGHAEAMR